MCSDERDREPEPGVGVCDGRAGAARAHARAGVHRQPAAHLERRRRAGRRKRLCPMRVPLRPGAPARGDSARGAAVSGAVRGQSLRRRVCERAEAGLARRRLFHLAGGCDGGAGRGGRSADRRGGGQPGKRPRLSADGGFHLLRRPLPRCEPDRRAGFALRSDLAWRPGHRRHAARRGEGRPRERAGIPHRREGRPAPALYPDRRGRRRRVRRRGSRRPDRLRGDDPRRADVARPQGPVSVCCGGRAARRGRRGARLRARALWLPDVCRRSRARLSAQRRGVSAARSLPPSGLEGRRQRAAA